jgi:RNA polymerase sigma-70 factor, ECF subfamily
VNRSREASFEDLYRAHSGSVYRFVLYLTHNTAVADDVTAETFLRVWSSPVPVQMETVRGWLLAIARNLVFEQARKTRREAEVTDLACALRLDESIDARRELAAVLAELGNLSEADRSALLLRSEGELSYREIAHIVGSTEQAVRVRVFRARARLEAARKELYGNPARSV